MSTAEQAPLERERIVSAALAIVDADGVEALSMRRLARALDAAPMSLYRHVRDKDEVLALVAEAVAELVPLPDEALPWQEAAGLLCRSVRAVLLDHRGVARLLLGPIPLTPAVLRLTEALLAALNEAGLGPADVAAAHEALWMMTVGSVIVEQTPTDVDAVGLRSQLVEAVDAASVDLPVLAATLPEWAALRSGQAFELGLELLLDGLASRAG